MRFYRIGIMLHRYVLIRTINHAQCSIYAPKKIATSLTRTPRRVLSGQETCCDMDTIKTTDLMYPEFDC